MLGKLRSKWNLLCDRQLGIDAEIEIRPADTSLHHDALKSISTDYGLIRRYIRHLELTPADIVYDIGCGTGRPLCLFAREAVARCIGIEMDPQVAAAARANAARLRGRRAPITVVEGDAATADYTDGTVFWLYNPFGPRTLAAVLERIRQNVETGPRPVRFCYLTPEAERVFSACGWLKRYKTVQPRLHRTGGASFWRN